MDKLKNGNDVTVDYIGRSITLQKDWRPRITIWLKNQYPKSKITEINVADNGTGVQFGVARIDKDLLAYNPDMVFVQFIVNRGTLRDLE